MGVALVKLVLVLGAVGFWAACVSSRLPSLFAYHGDGIQAGVRAARLASGRVLEFRQAFEERGAC